MKKFVYLKMSIFCLQLLSIFILSSCINATKNTIITTQPVTTQSNSRQINKNVPLPKNIAILPFINRTKNDQAFDIVRKTIFSHFAAKNYQTLHINEVDQRLKAASIIKPEQLDDFECRQLLNILKVDGLLSGEITHYNRTFLGVYAQVAVGVRLKLINNNCDMVWNAEKVVRKHEGGVSTTPVGLIMQTVAAAMHVREINLFRAADELGRSLMNDIPEPEFYSGKKLPKIHQVVHDGVNRILKYGDFLKVAIEGDPEMKASVYISKIGLFELNESQKGIYDTKIAINPDMNIKDAPVNGILQNNYGGKTTFTSPIGLLNIDNKPPDKVKNVKLIPKNNEIWLEFQPPDNNDIDKFQILYANTIQGTYTIINESFKNSFIHSNLNNFETAYYKILAIDKAQNHGQSFSISGCPFPDERFQSAKILPSQIPSEINELFMMRSKKSPYKLSQICDISESGSLIVESGTIIQIYKNAHFNIKGELQLYGSPKNPVQIISNNNSFYKYALVINSTKPVILKDTIINNGEIPVVIKDSSPQIINCKIINSRYSAIEIKGSARPLIKNSLIKGSNSGGIIIMDNSIPVFENNKFISNIPFHIQSSSPYLINAKGNKWKPPASKRTILGNIEY